MFVHQYELFRMKEDESIETMYSRFQTLVSGLQNLKKSYVASDHVNKILGLVQGVLNFLCVFCLKLSCLVFFQTLGSEPLVLDWDVALTAFCF